MRQTIIYSLLLITLTNKIKAHIKIHISDELFISKIDERTYIVTHSYPWPSNSLVFRTGKEVVLIDTPYENKATQLMLSWIKKELSPSKITAINTGFHVDNLGGNETLRKQGVDIYGSNLTTKLIDERSEKTRKQLLSWLSHPSKKKYYDSYKNLNFVKPNKVFDIQEGLHLKKEGFTFEVYYPGESHTPDNITIYIKEAQILFGSCIIKSINAKSLGFTGDANMEKWLESVIKIKNKYGKAKLVIPHHGNWGSLLLIKHTINLFNK